MSKFMTLCAILLLSCATAFGQKGAFKLKVKDDDNLNLPGASVTLSPGNYSGTTNQYGELILANVPAGEYTLAISYIGYGSVEKKITVQSNGTELVQTLSSKVVTGTEVIVMGDRLKGQARALNQQKNSDRVTNIISADQMGRFPDGNIGDAIKRVPGITMQNDQGEARNIIVRGMGPEFNSVTLNGERIPSAEGDNRRIQMDLIPTDMIQTVEVSKTLTADMDADAIGGSVNLITRTAPNGLRLSGTVAGGFNPIRDGFIGTANFIAGSRTANKKLGFVVSGSFNRNDFGSDNLEAAWAKDANGKPYINDHDLRIYDVIRVRRSLTTSLDYSINKLNTLYLTGAYTWRDDKENRFRLRHRARGGAGDLIYDANGDITGYTNGEVLRQTKGGINTGRNDGRRLEDQRVRSLALKGDHQWGKLKANWSVQIAKASEKRPNERYVAMGRRGITVNQDISESAYPLLTDNIPFTSYTRMDELTEQFQDQFERDINSRLDFSLPASIVKGQKGNFVFGARLRTKKKERNNTFFEYDPQSGFGNISQLPLGERSYSSYFPRNYAAGQFVTPDFLGGLDLKNASQFDESDAPAEYLAGNYSARERIFAGYAELRQHFTEKFSANIGLRVERTHVDYTGNIVEDEENLTGTANLKNNYTDILPDVNLRYQVNKDLVIKGAWTTSLARPRYYDLVPYFNIVPGDQQLSAGNPKLEPVRSTNFDLMVENYFKSVGIVSGGVFYKNINRFFYSYIDNNYTTAKFGTDFPGVTNPIAPGDNWDFSQRRNGDGATVWGLEAAIQRQLDFLPGFWKGFGVYLNYTYTHSKAEGIYDGDGQLIRSNVKLPGAAPHMFNASLSYESKKVVVRLSGNYTSSYVDDSDDAGYNEDPFFDRYYSKQFFLDANASYAFTPKFRLFAEANNLTNQPLRYYQGVSERTAQLEYYGPRFNMGIKFDLSK